MFADFYTLSFWIVNFSLVLIKDIFYSYDVCTVYTKSAAQSYIDMEEYVYVECTEKDQNWTQVNLSI